MSKFTLPSKVKVMKANKMKMVYAIKLSKLSVYLYIICISVYLPICLPLFLFVSPVYVYNILLRAVYIPRCHV